MKDSRDGELLLDSGMLFQSLGDWGEATKNTTASCAVNARNVFDVLLLRVKRTSKMMQSYVLL